MKKIALLTSFFLITLSAHECKYEIDVDIDAQKGILQGKAVITSDHPSMGLLDTKSNILEIKGAVLSIEKNIPNERDSS
ncbi:MAG: hypothetical protein QG559_346 [Campylobacterota bacterium]|nr:hypothetical protein [Campylobacterota bacterium]